MLVSILLRSHAISPRLLLNLWFRVINPEPKVHGFSCWSRSRPVSCPWWSPHSSTHHIPPAVTYAQSLALCFCHRKVMSLWAPSTRSFYVGVTLMTNHSQICVLPCAQTTSSLTESFPDSADFQPKMDSGAISKWVNSLVLKHLFWREFSNIILYMEFVGSQKLTQKPENALSNALLMLRFQNFAAGAKHAQVMISAIHCSHSRHRM